MGNGNQFGQVSVTKLTMPVAAVVAMLLATWQLPQYFMLRSAATAEHGVIEERMDTAHAGLADMVHRVRLQGDIAAANSMLARMEEQEMDASQRRDYDLLRFSVQDMTKRLRELR